MLWTLKGSFEDRVLTAAKAGIQSVELLNEYADWDDAAMARARKFVASFGMGIDAIAALPGGTLDLTIAAARKLNCPQVILRTARPNLPDQTVLAEKANLTLLLELSTSAEGLKLVKEVQNPHLRLALNVYDEHMRRGDVLAAVKEAVDYTAVFHIAGSPGRSDPGLGEIKYKEIYQALQKSGYSRYVAMEYTPAGEPVTSLIKAVDGFRAVLAERPAVASS